MRPVVRSGEESGRDPAWRLEHGHLWYPRTLTAPDLPEMAKGVAWMGRDHGHCHMEGVDGNSQVFPAGGGESTACRAGRLPGAGVQNASVSKRVSLAGPS